LARSRFEEVERGFAAGWREQLNQADHATGAKLVRQFLRIRETPKSVQEARALAEEIVRGAEQWHRRSKLHLTY
jgi:hypothetical protein